MSYRLGFHQLAIAAPLLAFANMLAGCGGGSDQPAPVITAAAPSQVVGSVAGTPAASSTAEHGFTTTALATFNEPWAMTIIPNSPYILITEKKGVFKLLEQGGTTREIPAPVAVYYGGQGGLGDVVLAPDFATTGRILYSFAELTPGGAAGAVVAQTHLVLNDGPPRFENGRILWKQDPKVSDSGHYSHRIAFSPDGQHVFIASGDRQKMEPAQDMASALGKIIRLETAGFAAPADNPFAAQGGVTATIWSLGHRNILGLAYDGQNRLWGLEHGPAGGDELNLIRAGANYGWPRASNGSHYDGTPIPDHTPGDGFAAPAISWNPVIAPGGMVFYKGDAFPNWRGDALIAGLASQALIRVRINGESAQEMARYPMSNRIREVELDAAGNIWLLEDGEGARLLKLTPKAP